MIRYYNENTKFDTFIDDVINSLFPEGAPHDALIEFDYVKELAGNTAGLSQRITLLSVVILLLIVIKSWHLT